MESYRDLYSNDVPTAAFLAFEDGCVWGDEEREHARREAPDGEAFQPDRPTNAALAEYDKQLRQAKEAVQ
jgi:hypothetical protein